MRISQLDDKAASHPDQDNGAPKPMVNNVDLTASPQPPLQRSASVLDRRGARAKEHQARPPARFNSLLNQELNNQNQTPCRWHGQKKVPNLFQDLTGFVRILAVLPQHHANKGFASIQAAATGSKHRLAGLGRILAGFQTWAAFPVCR